MRTRSIQLAAYLLSRRRPVALLKRTAESTGCPFWLLTAVYCTESYFRPGYFRAVEYTVLLCKVVLFGWSSASSLSLGPFQVRVAHLLTLAIEEEMNPADTQSKRKLLPCVFSAPRLWTLSARFIRWTWEQTGGTNTQRAIAFGRLYNNSAEYGALIAAFQDLQGVAE